MKRAFSLVLVDRTLDIECGSELEARTLCAAFRSRSATRRSSTATSRASAPAALPGRRCFAALGVSRRAPAAASWDLIALSVIGKPPATGGETAACPRTPPMEDGCALLPAAAGPAAQAYAASLCYSCGRDSKLRSCHHEAHARAARLETREGMQGCPYEQMALARRGAGAGPRRLVVVAAAAARAGCHPFDARRPTAGARRARPTAGARAAAGAAAVGRLRALRLRVAPAAAGRRDAVRRVLESAHRVQDAVPPRAALPARRLPRGRHSGGPRGGPAGARALARLPRAGGRLGHRRPAARGAVGRDGPERRPSTCAASTACSSGTRWRTSTSSCASTTTSSSWRGRPTTHSGCSGRATRTTPGAPRRASRTARRPGPSAPGSGPTARCSAAAATAGRSRWASWTPCSSTTSSRPSSTSGAAPTCAGTSRPSTRRGHLRPPLGRRADPVRGGPALRPGPRRAARRRVRPRVHRQPHRAQPSPVPVVRRRGRAPAARAADDGAVARAVAAHAASFADDLVAAGVPRAWTEPGRARRARRGRPPSPTAAPTVVGAVTLPLSASITGARARAHRRLEGADERARARARGRDASAPRARDSCDDFSAASPFACALRGRTDVIDSRARARAARSSLAPGSIAGRRHRKVLDELVVACALAAELDARAVRRRHRKLGLGQREPLARAPRPEQST